MTTQRDYGCKCKCKCTPRACLHVRGRKQTPCTCACGRLSPWAEPATGALGWEVTTPSRRLAEAVATESQQAIPATGNDEWLVRVRKSVLAVTVANADTVTMRCTVAIHPHAETFIMEFAPWTAEMVIKCPVAALPASGRLSVRDVRITTRMGRTVRYLIPEFRPP